MCQTWLQKQVIYAQDYLIIVSSMTKKREARVCDQRVNEIDARHGDDERAAQAAPPDYAW
jgi:hypothetical protein